MNVLDLANKRVELKKVASTKGGEYAGPCPGCGGDDRFHVWPAEKSGEGSWWCRGCNKGGDAIQFLIEFEGKTFPEACDILNKPLPDPENFHGFHTNKHSNKHRHTSSWAPGVSKPPDGVDATVWREKARKFVEWAHEKLLANDQQLAYLAGRGIDKDSVVWFRLGFNPGTRGSKAIFRPRESWGLPSEKKEDGKPKKLWIPRGVVIPCMAGDDVLRIRIRRPDQDLTPKFKTKYYVVPGSTMAPMLAGADKKGFVVVETELDAVMLHQAAGDLVGVLAMGSASAKPDRVVFEILKASFCILNALDFDRAGYAAGKWWQDNFNQVSWWPVPDGKDPGDAYAKGVNLREWILAGLPPAWHVGPYSLVGDNKGAPAFVGAVAGNDDDRSEPASERKGAPNQIPDGPLGELYGYLKKYPIKIKVTDKKLSLIEAAGWKNWEAGKRVSELVFFNDEVFEYLHNHPDDMVGAGNFWR